MLGAESLNQNESCLSNRLAHTSATSWINSAAPPKMPRWLSDAQFRRGARDAWELLESEREMFEDYYRKARAAFAAMRKQAENV